jgi:uncharacterized protein
MQTPRALQHREVFSMHSPQDYLDLLDYRRRVAGIYAGVRAGPGDLAERQRRFRAERDELFRTHPQSALSPEQRARFTGLRYWDYDPAYRFVLPVEPVESRTLSELDLGDDGCLRMQRFATVRFTLGGQACTLALFWLLGYGGGVFLPFRDLTNDAESYGGGRYLLDTLKHADIGQVGDRLVLDFNFAYNPSCAYNARWVCPLAPRENRLNVRVEAGEQRYPGAL